MRTIAMYLPQFHRVKENDEWWGEGFTDWTAVKNARPLYERHRQPHVPLDENYYDLTDRRVMEWQASLMKKYCVDGMCMYHYWFRDGRRILEKPAENLLQWKDIHMPFCFCWANETWARSWSNVRDKNVWANTAEKEGQEERGREGILLEQSYGGEQQWKEHFDYLLPFFRDDRYITVDGKPVFVIYRASGIPCLGEMLELWRSRALENGLGGLYIIGIWAGKMAKSLLDARLYQEPARAWFSLREQKPGGAARYSYDELWENILAADSDGKTFFGGFVSYDDTPRRGGEGWLAEGSGPEKFRRYLTRLMAKNEAYKNELLFLNAWNEWGEGMYLEPDTQYGYGFLEAIPYAKNNCQGLTGYYRKQAEKHTPGDVGLKDIPEQKEKDAHYLALLDTWMERWEDGIRLEDWFSERGYRAVGVYGYGVLGRHLVRELRGSNIEIRYLVDRRRDRLYTDITMYLPEEKLPAADVLVVAATYYYEEIRRRMKENGVESIVSLEQIIGECGHGSKRNDCNGA